MKTTEELNSEKEELKKKYQVIYTLRIPLDDDETTFGTYFLKKLDRLTYKTVSKVISKDELLGTEMLLKNLAIGGDNVEDIFGDKNFDALRSASVACIDIIKAKEGILKKN